MSDVVRFPFEEERPTASYRASFCGCLYTVLRNGAEPPAEPCKRCGNPWGEPKPVEWYPRGPAVFMAALEESPDDVGKHQAFADWLEERGRPGEDPEYYPSDADRAAFQRWLVEVGCHPFRKGARWAVGHPAFIDFWRSASGLDISGASWDDFETMSQAEAQMFRMWRWANANAERESAVSR